jgi:transglutaminase/protease-like cytokinesis protein 3
MSEAVLNHRANCVGFSTTFRYIMNMLGIECLALCGYDQAGVAHQWNAIRLGGEWYNVDATKDRAYLVSDYSNYAHYFFNCTDKRLTDYGFVFGLKYCPNPNITCTATRYSYDNLSG